MAQHRFRHEDYTVGWVCALPVELAASRKMLDRRHPSQPQHDNDSNVYTLGRIGQHNVVMACLPKGFTGTNSATAVAIQMKSTFPSIRFGLMVGIGGGVPGAGVDIRLGDVVVGQPHMGHGGVVQYDFGKSRPNGFERTGFLNAPPTVLLNSLAILHANHLTGESNLSEYLSTLSNLPTFAHDNTGPDDLFQSSYTHIGGDTCERCSKKRLVKRTSRTEDIVVHFGTIASGNQVMRDGIVRDRLSKELDGALCFEMEAAGMMNSFPCLVIRGISDYADSHKNKRWQGYAAATAAACAKEVLSIIPASEIETTPTVDEAINVEVTNRTKNFIHDHEATDLLQHFHLDAVITGECTTHTEYEVDQGVAPRKVEKRWYRGKEPIGRSTYGNGKVWLERDDKYVNRRAVKIMPKNLIKGDSIDYKKEILALAKFSKPQYQQQEVLVKFLGWFEDTSDLFLYMEYFELGDLEGHITESITEDEVKDITTNLLNGLRIMHTESFSHRGLKPGNIFVVRKPPAANWWVKIGDFGISKRVNHEQTALYTSIGTRPYMAPEVTGDLDIDEPICTHVQQRG